MKVKEKILYKGKWIDLKKAKARINGKEIEKEFACTHSPKAVAILPVVGKNKIILVKQYRFAAKREIWEIPAGFLKKNEKPEITAKRELEEETGFKAKKLKKIAEFFQSPGYLREYIYLFKAYVEEKGKQSFDKDEFIKKVKIFTQKEVLKMIKEKKIVDAKTIIAILLWKLEGSKK